MWAWVNRDGGRRPVRNRAGTARPAPPRADRESPRRSAAPGIVGDQCPVDQRVRARWIPSATALTSKVIAATLRSSRESSFRRRCRRGGRSPPGCRVCLGVPPGRRPPPRSWRVLDSERGGLREGRAGHLGEPEVVIERAEGQGFTGYKEYTREAKPPQKEIINGAVGTDGRILMADEDGCSTAAWWTAGSSASTRRPAMTPV